MDRSKQFVLWFNEIGIDDVGLVGGKNASLGEMYQNLAKKGVRVPNGFAITAYSYQYLLEKSGVMDDLKAALKGLDVRDVRALAEAGRKAREIILRCEVPEELRREIVESYQRLCKE